MGGTKVVTQKVDCGERLTYTPGENQMAIITWMENGIKQFALFDAKYFTGKGQDFPVFESHRRSFSDIVSFSDDEVLLVSGDRKRYRMVQPGSALRCWVNQKQPKQMKMA